MNRRSILRGLGIGLGASVVPATAGAQAFVELSPAEVRTEFFRLCDAELSRAGLVRVGGIQKGSGTSHYAVYIERGGKELLTSVHVTDRELRDNGFAPQIRRLADRRIRGALSTYRQVIALAPHV